MPLKLGDIVPNFKAESTHGEFLWHDKIKGQWTILFSHPNDFTPVCTTELGTVAALYDEFVERGVKVYALSCNTTDSHLEWIKDIEAAKWSQGKKVLYPIISDPDRNIADLYGMIDPDEEDANKQKMTARAVFIIGPDARLKLSILYPATTGRNFYEILRVIDSLFLTREYSVATPVDWKRGGTCMVVPTLSDEEALKKFKSYTKLDVPSGKGYIRMTADPNPKHKKPLPHHLVQALTAAGVFAAGILIGNRTKKN